MFLIKEIPGSGKMMLWFLGALLVLASGIYFIHIVRHIKMSACQFGFADMPIFLETSRRFLQDGILYVPSIADYRPGASVYKYPPLLAALLLPLAQYDQQQVLHLMWLACITIFLAAACYGLYLFRPKQRPAPYFFIAIVLTLNFSPFFETLLGLQMEIPIMLMLLGCLHCINKKLYSLAGAMIAMATMLKIYPVFMMLYFCIRFRLAAWLGFFVTLIVLGILMVCLFGYHTNHWYIVELLPVLLQEPALLQGENANFARVLLNFSIFERSTCLFLSQLIFMALLIAFFGKFFVSARKHPGALDEAVVFSLIIVLMLLALTNSWINYQMLLWLPFMVLVSRALDGKKYGLLLWVVLAVVLTLFTENAGVNGMILFPMDWHSTMVLYRGCATLMLALALLALPWHVPVRRQ